MKMNDLQNKYVVSLERDTDCDNPTFNHLVNDGPNTPIKIYDTLDEAQDDADVRNDKYCLGTVSWHHVYHAQKAFAKWQEQGVAHNWHDSRELEVAND